MKLLLALLAGMMAEIVLANTDPERAPLSLDEATRKVVRGNQGRVLGARTERQEDDREVHVIRMLSPDGRRVQHFRVDPTTGEVLGRSSEAR